ncbi:CNH domain-containing protein [Cokeromyces recurvatus]|uniref:CNH domain-containing protein n=1 Tax=Cokeromyces recurvatus TaxID=90255 RepID=UPI002220D492|nr:CNH domain-containing protein [Cokeromyces recurvatus]KAI7903046.1 CNH domain-containing protein [Cokeromyces recurvatus]
MHDAFQVTTVVDKLTRIESIFAHGDRLLIGTGVGHLLVYDIKEPLVADDNEIPEVTLFQTIKTFSKRPIEQLDIIKEIDVLVSLSDGLVSLHDLRTFELRMALGKTKGANLFAIQTMVEMTPEEQIPVLTTRLAVAVRKKLLVFVWKDTEFYETKELTIPDRIKAMTWVGLTKICLGFSAEYALMDVEEGRLTELFAPTTGVTEAGPMSTLNSLYNMSIGARGGKPMITKIPNNEMLLARDHVSIFLGLDGTPTRKVGIEWSGTPEQIGYSYPYVIAILPKHVEVRNIQTLTLVQQIDLANTKFLNQGKLVYVASTSQIYRLTPYSFSSQIDQLVEKKEYKEAASLLDQIDAVLIENKEKKLKTIRTAYAHDLFTYGEYDKAINLFQELDTPAAEVISLYPEVISGHLAKEETYHHGSEGEEEEQGSAISKKHRDQLEEETNISRPSSRASTRSKATSQLSQSKTKKNEIVPLTGLHLYDAVTYLIRYLTDRRQKLARKLSAHSSGPASVASSTKHSETLDDDEEDLLYQAMLVDTSLLKSYMMTNDALVGPLLRVQNHCNVEECEKILMDKKKYKELVDLYNCKGLHGRALDLLEKLGKQSDGPLKGVSPTIRYLQKLGLDHFDLVLHYSQWVLEKDPEHGMDIFMDDLAEVETFPRDKVLKHLETISNDLAIQYLEYIIEELHDESPDFHNRLVIAYLGKINFDKKKEDKENKNKIRTKLITFLTDSSCYKAEKILSRLPIDDLFEERAILLSRIGQHDQALDIYVYKLKNYAMAEEYCTKVYQEDPLKGEKMYLTLLKVYLKPTSNQHRPLIEPALKLLAHHGSHIDASEVLSILPEKTKLLGLFPFFEKYIREANKNRNMDLIVKNLLKAEQIQVEEQLMYYRSRAVKITEDRMCPQCNKRIGNSVFAVFPNGVVVHYSCKEKIEQTQWKLI